MDVISLCKEFDIILLQEHWLPIQDLEYFNSIHDDYMFIAYSPVDLSQSLLVGRPHGGLCVLYHRDFSKYIRLIDDSNPRLLCFEILNNDEKILVGNCYLPYDDRGRNLIDYIEILHKFNSICIEGDYSHIILLGDFNCHINSNFWRELCAFTDINKYHISDVEVLGLNSNTATYISDINNEGRWLDHLVTSEIIHENISCIEVFA